MKKETATTHAEILPTYRRLRQIGLQINNKLVGTLSKEVIHEGGRTLGILKNDTLVLGSEDEMSVLMDFCIHSVRVGGQSAVQRYVEQSRARVGSDEEAMLTAMLGGRYSLIQVIDAEHGVGVTVRDLLRNDTFFVADIGLGTTGGEGAVFATRLFSLEDHGFHVTGGAGLPVTPPTLEAIKKMLGREFAPGTDFARLDPDRESGLVALVVRTCLALGMSSGIMYGSAAETSSRKEKSIDPRKVRRANPNDPCPCGSDRKFKSCCGRRPRL